MADDILESYISQYLESQPQGEVNFIWQGGEPTLMGLSFFKKALEFQRKYKRSDQTVLNSFQTNGILLDDDWGRFLADNHFLVGLSMDGPPAYHDTLSKREKS